MLKKIIITVVVALAVAAGVLYAYRYAIIKFYAEKLIRENLPGYIKIGEISFDFANNRFSVNDFRVLNPPGFPSPSLVSIKKISYNYSIKGMLKCLEISDVLLDGIDLRIERLSENNVNMSKMDRFVENFQPAPAKGSGQAPSGVKAASAAFNTKDLASLIKLPVSYKIKDSRLAFLDRVPYGNPYIITIESVSGEVSISFSDDYSSVKSLSFALSGVLNGERRENIRWEGSLNPATPRLTMSNRFEVSGLNLLTFEPYYDSFSPLVFRRGRVSGTLVFDFNNGNIGSTNEVYLSDLAFSVKKGYENAQFWGSTVPEIMRYFTTMSGDVVFDFKLKGDMAKPTFYLGPISKRALTSMIVDKITSYAIEQATKQDGGNDIDKAKEALDVVRQLLKKNQ